MSSGLTWGNHVNRDGVVYHDLHFPKFPFAVGWVSECPPRYRAVSMAMKIEARYFDTLDEAKEYLLAETMLWLMRLGEKNGK